MSRPFASVLIDTYNHQRFIEQAVLSVLEQDFPIADREILVVDDGSTDKTAEILRKFEPQIRLLCKENGGQASAFNLGIPECRGEIVAFLDGDDWWAPGKLGRVVDALRAEPDLEMVGHGIVVVGRDGKEQIETLGEGHRFRANTVEGGKLFRRRCAFLGTSRMTIRTALLKKIGPVPAGIRIQADEYLFTLAAVLGEVGILPEAMTFYRMHESNGFQLVERPDPDKLRRKQGALAALASSLWEKLEEFGVSYEVRHTVLDYTRACADQIRLTLDGGWPWETVQTEWTLYQILHPDASLSHRMFKMAMLAGALATPPKLFYGVKGALSQSDAYRKTRQRWLPAPEMRHIRKEGRAKP